MTQTTLQELKAQQAYNRLPAPQTEIGFSTADGFVLLQRMANMFASSSLVPESFRGQQNIGNAAIALDMAIRMKANPLAVMQNIYLVHGRPAWSAQFLIATLNKCGKFSALRYRFEGEKGNDSWGCCAIAKELASGEELVGPTITIAMAKKDGWYGRNGSKWQVIPELMLRYRAASWFVRTYAPEICMGLPDADELKDTIDITPVEDVAEEVKQIGATVEEIKEKARRERKVNNQSLQPESINCPEIDGHVVTPAQCEKCLKRQGCPSWG